MRNCLPSVPLSALDVSDSSPDVFLWKNSHDLPPGNFSAAKTWKSLYPPLPLVSWHNSVWYKEHIPKHAFILWLAVQNRLVTRDRLRSWGLNVSEVCLLCGAAAETRDHLFFNCLYSEAVWSAFFNHGTLTPPSNFNEVVSWVASPFTSVKIKTICRLIFQAVVYFIWAERNARLHTPSTKASHILVKEIQLILRAKLSGLDRTTHASSHASLLSTVHQPSFIYTWFEFFQI
uniref:Reverse transcriptase zinc-binding domain-containing protein n=2 Tax=Noccaea caerulescens TaxID=107243 RepID=A0A1J3HF68_NOCCA